MNFMMDRKIHIKSNVFIAAQRWKKSNYLILGLNEPIDYLAMANSVHWYSHVLRRALNFEVEVKGKKGSRRGHGRIRLMKQMLWLV